MGGHNENSTFGGPNQELPSGKWSGYFVDDRDDIDEHPENKWPIDVVLTFQDHGRSFIAFGTDEVGTFQLKEGKVQGNELSFIKAYHTHTVHYKGLIVGRVVSGEWWLSDWPTVRGTFSMWPDQQ